MRLFIFILIGLIATVLTGGWFWAAVIVWCIYAGLYKLYKKFEEKGRIK